MAEVLAGVATQQSRVSNQETDNKTFKKLNRNYGNSVKVLKAATNKPNSKIKLHAAETIHEKKNQLNLIA